MVVGSRGDGVQGVAEVQGVVGCRSPGGGV